MRFCTERREDSPSKIYPVSSPSDGFRRIVGQLQKPKIRGVCGHSPRFGVLAFRDPGTQTRPGTPLQRVQIVKGWVDGGGQSHEKVFDVAGDPNDGASVIAMAGSVVSTRAELPRESEASGVGLGASERARFKRSPAPVVQPPAQRATGDANSALAQGLPLTGGVVRRI